MDRSRQDLCLISPTKFPTTSVVVSPQQRTAVTYDGDDFASKTRRLAYGISALHDQKRGQDLLYTDSIFQRLLASFKGLQT